MSERVRIDIDRLVIESATGDREELVRAIRAELERLYATSPVAVAGRPGRLEIADRVVESAAGGAPRDIGRPVAMTIWNSAREAGRGEETR